MGTNSRVYDDSACGKQEEWIKLLFKKKKVNKFPPSSPWWPPPGKAVL